MGDGTPARLDSRAMTQADLTRQRLIRAALELFTTTGYHFTTTPLIARKGGWLGEAGSGRGVGGGVARCSDARGRSRGRQGVARDARRRTALARCGLGRCRGAPAVRQGSPATNREAVGVPRSDCVPVAQWDPDGLTPAAA